MSATSNLDFDPQRLSDEGPRLQAITGWLTGTVWSPERYAASSSEDYFREGEAAVYGLEKLIAAGAPRVWDELAAESATAPTLADWLGLSAPLPLPSPHAAVVFDGLSLRELPMLLAQASASGFRVKSARTIGTCLPTETRSFVEQRVLGRPASPSELPGKREFAEKNAQAFYFGQPNSRDNFPAGRSLLVWSHYPDGLFFDDNARSEKLFDTFASYIETIWKCTVQAIPAGIPIVVTSDHGYVFFGAGGEVGALQADAGSLVEQSRWREFPPGVTFPAWHPDLQLIPSRRLALLRGRIRTRKPGPSSNRLYQHGGFSLMEVLVPWLELERT
jgi:hypothetical protein